MMYALNNLLLGFLRRTQRWLIVRKAKGCTSDNIDGAKSLWGYGLRVSFPDTQIWLHQFVEIFCDDCYRIHRIRDDVPLVYDIGANTGMFALHLKWMFPMARVVSVEPDTVNYRYLVQNINENGLTNVDAFNKAIMGKQGFVDMAGTTSDSLQAVAAEQGAVAAVTLDDLVTSPCSLIKIDIEGAEISVLAASLNALSLTDRLCVEYHEFRDKRSRFQELIKTILKGDFNRLDVTQHRTYMAPNPISYCCLVHAWRV